MYLYGCAGDLAAGDQISGVMNVTTTVYKNLPEVTAFTLVDGYTKTSGNTVTPEEVTLAALEADYENYISRYVVVKGGSITAFSSKNATLTQGSNEITVHDQVGSLTATDGAAVNVYGHPSIYNSTHQLAVWEQTQIEETTVDPIDPTITVADADVEYGSTFTISESDITGGSVTVTSSNEAVATVSGLEITPVAVGTTTITVSTAATSVYNAGSKTFELTVTAPVGQDKAGANAVFYEGFSGCTTSGGNDGTWNAGLGDLNDVTLATGLTLSEKAYAASACVRLGTSSAQGSATITVAVKTGNTYTLSFNAAPWSSEGATVMTVNVTGGTISGISDAAMTPQQWTAYVGTVTATADELTIEIVSTGSKRFFLDEISLSSEALFNVTLNSKGYASYANVSPLDFTDAESDGYSAWEITNISGSTITFNQITEAIKGGQGVLLKGTASATVQIPSVDSETELTSNLLTGTTAPSYVDADKYYGLSGETFKKMNAGTVKANKAVIDASLISSSVKTLTFVFNSVDGIQTVETVSAEEAAQIFDLSGRRLAQPRKGVNIIGGKKVLVK